MRADVPSILCAFCALKALQAAYPPFPLSKLFPPLFQSSCYYGFVLYPQLLDLGFQIRDQEMMVSRVGNFALRYRASFLFHSFYSRLRNIGKNSPS